MSFPVTLWDCVHDLTNWATTCFNKRLVFAAQIIAFRRFSFSRDTEETWKYWSKRRDICDQVPFIGLAAGGTKVSGLY